jgi:hypothetical protein
MALARKNGVCDRSKIRKGDAGSKFLEPPASFVAARTFVLNDTSPLSRRLARLIYSICVPLQQFYETRFYSMAWW